jgi:hypothetical protein
VLPEPPAGYVDFVARHLDPLRRDAARVVGADGDADRLYPEVLTDVAGRWAWLRLRGRLHLPDGAEDYLRSAFARRSAQFLRPAGDGGEPRPVEFEVWAGDTPASPPPRRSSAATRLAPHLPPTRRVEVGALAEAAIAWCHAYEVQRRRRVTALIVAVALFVLWAIHYVESTG